MVIENYSSLFNLQGVCFGERKCSEDYFLVRRSVSPGDQLQTKHSAHSAVPLHPTDKRRMLDKRSQQKTSLFPPIIESNAEWGEEAKLHNIIYTGIWRSALSNLCQKEMG